MFGAHVHSFVKEGGSWSRVGCPCRSTGPLRRLPPVDHASTVLKTFNGGFNAITKHHVDQHKNCTCFRTRFGTHFSDKNVRRGLGLGELELARKAAYFGALVPAGPQLLRRRAPSVLDLESDAQTQKGTKQKTF